MPKMKMTARESPVVEKTVLSISRPVVRSFHLRFSERAALWVRLGGHAVVREKCSDGETMFLVIPIPDPKNDSDLHLFSILDLRRSGYKWMYEGPFRNLAKVMVPPKLQWILLRRIERDSIHPDPQKIVELDCLSCGQCCKENQVFLYKRDITRLKKSGLDAILSPPYSSIRRVPGLKKTKIIRKLSLIGADKRCIQLAQNNTCGIYNARPDACRHFPPASESCLYTREADLKIYDGLEPQLHEEGVT